MDETMGTSLTKESQRGGARRICGGLWMRTMGTHIKINGQVHLTPPPPQKERKVNESCGPGPSCGAPGFPGSSCLASWSISLDSSCFTSDTA